jgi:LacI family transcriptional regulator
MVPRRKRASLKEVAALAGTSTATVSRAISGRGYVAAVTRSRITKAISELNYQPNLQARALRQRTSRIIGLLIPNLLNVYYTNLADELSQLLNELGYRLTLASTRDDPDIERDMLLNMVGHAIDGLVWVPTGGTPELVIFLKEQHTPSIAIVRRVQNDALDTVVFEDFEGSLAANRYLINLGHGRIAFIGGDTKHSSNYDRLQGYIKALEEAGIPTDNSLIEVGSTRNIWGEMATNELLHLSSPPSAIFVASNAIMPGVLKTLRQYRVQIPERMSLICFDDLDWFTYSMPPITAVTTSPATLAKAAVDLLMKRIEQGDEFEGPPVLIKINFELILRDSVLPFWQGH